MSKIAEYNITDYCRMLGAECVNPLVCVIDFSKLPPLLFNQPVRMFGYYAIYLKGPKYTELHYGNTSYDYSEGALVFFGPGQVAGSECDGLRHQVQGHVLMFHPDLIAGTPLQQFMPQYSYFSYNTREALFPTRREKSLLLDMFGKIDDELHQTIPDFTIITDYIKLSLDYCLRAYDRQFQSQPTVNNDILARFENLCDDYYNSGQSKTQGLLTVQYCADHMCFSVNYLSDLIRKSTGMSPQKHIQQKTMNKAQTLLLTTSKRINEIAAELGFQQPQNFSNWFKRIEECTPNKYRETMGNKNSKNFCS